MDFSYQLYSARNGGPLADTLRTLKDLGYTQVEGWGGQFENPQALADTLKASGLTMPTAHMGFTQLEDTDKAADIARLVGVRTFYCPAPPSADFREGKADWAEFGRRLGRVGEALTAKGIGFGYHNHHWEFAKTADGRFPLDILMTEAPGLEWEMDLAWLVKGGQEPLAWMDKYGKRMTALHVKDIAPAGEQADEDGWADVGTGTLDWKALIDAARAKTAVRYFVAEHDKPNDPIRFARNSIAAVKQWM